MVEARRKELLRYLSLLQAVNLGFSGGERAREAHKDMLNEYYMLEGIDKRREEIEANWEILKMSERVR